MTEKQDFRIRTRAFTGTIIQSYVSLPKNREEVRVVGRQMLRSGTSVAANYREASRARSGAEFIAKVELCTQEADETQLWLELLMEDCDIQDPSLKELRQEADELISIFVTMAKNTKAHHS